MRVAIIHPWFPQYRKEFFEQLLAAGQAKGIHIDLYHGAAPPEVVARNDAWTSDVACLLPTRFIKIGRRHMGIKSLTSVYEKPRYDVVVLEQAVRNVETYATLVRPLSRYLAYWGHGKTYTKKVSKLQEWVKLQLTLRADWFFAYTEGGARHVVEAGFPAGSVTVVNNTIDSTRLAESIRSVNPHEKLDFLRNLSITGTVGLFIGGLDESKRLQFLINACRHVRHQIPEFTLLLAGDGPDRQYIEQAAQKYCWIKYIGPVFGREKAIAMSVADVFVMPGRVGLVAVDSFAAQVPIITTDWEWHAPEFEYLRNNFNALIARNSEEDYAATLVDILQNDKKRNKLVAGCQASVELYNTASMVSRFVEGLENIQRTIQ